MLKFGDKMNKRTRLFYLAAIIVIFIGIVTEIDFKDLSWSNNSTMYLTGSGVLVAIIALIHSLVLERNGKPE